MSEIFISHTFKRKRNISIERTGNIMNNLYSYLCHYILEMGALGIKLKVIICRTDV